MGECSWRWLCLVEHSRAGLRKEEITLDGPIDLDFKHAETVVILD